MDGPFLVCDGKFSKVPGSRYGTKSEICIQSNFLLPEKKFVLRSVSAHVVNRFYDWWRF